MRRKKARFSNRTATLSLASWMTGVTVLVLLLWLAGMAGLTWCVAADMKYQLEEQERQMLFQTDILDFPADSLPGSREQTQISNLGRPYYFFRLNRLLPIVGSQTLGSSVGSDEWLWGKWDLYYGFEPAILYYGPDGAGQIATGNYITFSYTDAQAWEKRDYTPQGQGYLCLDSIPNGLSLGKYITNFAVGDHGPSYFLTLLRLEGSFVGQQFQPRKIDRAANLYGDITFYDADVKTLAGAVRSWETLLEDPAAASEVTIYAWDVGGILHTHRPVSAGGRSFESLTQLLKQSLAEGETWAYEKDSLLDFVSVRFRTLDDGSGVALALRAQPAAYAALRLLPVYGISFALVLVILLLLRRSFWRRFGSPLRAMAESAREGTLVTPHSSSALVWQVEDYVSQTQQQLTQEKNRTQRLQTALIYAREGEENRKTLISNLAHELKTPLAILHSSAELLQEPMTTAQQQVHLRGILEETERMDTMVMQMLELSRLEAGRSRLSVDRINLLLLTKQVLQRMQPMFDQKQLPVQLLTSQDFTVMADEARMEQAITNLLSNALKYTTPGGTVRIRVYCHNANARFFVDNDAPHLSQKDMEKVWDSFYRVDRAHRTQGSGLGLTIVHSIVQLHGGECQVRNLSREDGSPAVEFGFTIPLK